jgi:tRNA(fMet)-specific endonuclease VapC
MKSLKVCLDSDFIINLLNGDSITRDKLQYLIENNAFLSTTAINSLEVFYGIVNASSSSSTKILATREFFNTIDVLNLTHQSAERSAYILSNFRKAGNPIGIKDTMIAGIVLENSLTLVTRNIKHFERIPGIILHSW